MKKQPLLCTIQDIRPMGPGIYSITVQNAQLAGQAQPGQFIHIKCGPEFTLRRPISICDACEDKLTFLFEVRGEGTDWLARRQVGETLDIMGPLGHGYDVQGVERALVIGGGIGIYPLYLTARKIFHCDAVLGFRTKELVVYEKQFRQVCDQVAITTDDGSYGEAGLVTGPMKRLVAENHYDRIYACGPLKMLQAIAQVAKEAGIPCQVSMEQRMGCGIGACLVCACKVKSGMSDTEWKYSHVCKAGPVYDAEEVIFE
ncbi:MAG: dihydroorotate dehydrogenase electron transfer subunit [Eubacteriales bacterium]